MNASYFSISYACNQKCLFCPCTKEEKKYPFISLDDLISSADKLLSDGNVNSIVISGGEPTLNPAFVDFLAYLLSKGIYVTVLSNSEKFFDVRLTSVMKEKLPDLTKLSVITTIHSEDAHKHEHANQTGGSFERTLQGLDNLIDAGIQVIIKHCITKANYQELKSFYNFIDGRFPAEVSIQLCSIDYLGIEEDRREENMVVFPELETFLGEMFDEHLKRVENGNERHIYCINMPYCSCDPYYWQFLTSKNDSYSGYASPGPDGSSQVSISVDNNVGTFGHACQNCRVAEICPGTYKTAFDYFGDRIVKEIQY